MRKIIQFLRLSRLVLLVILLLIAVIAKIARAETAYLYTNHYGATGYFGTAQAACAAIPKISYPMFASEEINGRGSCYYVQQGTGSHIGIGSYARITKTCDAKELTHNGTSGGVDGTPPNLHWMLAPEGVDAKDWYSDKFTTCENNCVVKNTRRLLSNAAEQGLAGVSADGRSVTESSGKSRSLFYKRQTGVVCVPQKKKADDSPKPPAPDNGDGSDGSSGSDTGNANSQNNGQGGSNQGDSSNQSGSNSSDNQGSGNSDGGGSSSGGSGGGKGGNSGGSSHIIPGGNSNGGSSSGGDKNEGSEGSDGDGQSGDGKNGSGSGEGGGTDSENGSGQGNVNGAQNQGQGQGQSGQMGQTGSDGGTGQSQNGSQNNGQGQGKEEGEGKGSVSGGSCEANKAPHCKGDPVQCYIAVEQWRTACAAMGNKGKIDGGDCSSLTPPKCEGDATQCYIAKQQFFSACEAQAQREARDGLKGYADGKSGLISDVESASEDGVKSALQENSSSFDLTNIIDRSGFGLSRSCPASAVVDAGMFGRLEFDNSMLCTMAQVLGKVFVALSMIFAVRYVFA